MGDPRLATVVCTTLALLGFAGNSVLCRMALGARAIDPVSFTSLRLLSGAVALALLSGRGRLDVRAGNMRGAIALFGYALAFSLAYVDLPTGTGALILFGCVQLTMFGAGLWSGEKPRLPEWVGLIVAFGGLAVLLAPGVTAPDPLAAMAMAVAGGAWGAYSLLGRGSLSPLATTAGNFARATPLAMIASALAIGLAQPRVSMKGALLAATSGALTSGVGYALWYAALPNLSRARAAVVQLTVPLLAALLGGLWLAEPFTLRWGLAALAILGGVSLALRSKR